MSTCHKTTYVSEADAKYAAKSIKTSGRKLRACHCPHCGGHHLTSQTAKQRRAAKKHNKRVLAMPQAQRILEREKMENEKVRLRRERMREVLG